MSYSAAVSNVAAVYVCSVPGLYRDPMVEGSELLQRIDRLTAVACSLFRAPWPVSRRDMHAIARGERIPTTGAYFTYGTSVTNPPTVHPSPRGVIRANLIYYGTLITPLPAVTGGARYRCRVVFVGCSDPRGMLPSTLVSIAAQLQPLNINRLVTFSKKAGVADEVERKLMEGIREAGFDEEEGRLNDKTAAPLASGVDGVETGGAEKEDEEADGEEKKVADEEAEQEVAGSAAATDAADDAE